jgi:hypothetical protein
MVEVLIQTVDPPQRRHRIRLCWIAAHKDVRGNEKADKEAKKAASGAATSVEHLPPLLRSLLPPSIGVTKHQYLLKLREEWIINWSLSPRKARMEKMDEDFPYEKHCNNIDGLTCVQSSLLFQIRSNHLPLNNYLHRIGKAPSKRCDRCWRRRRVEATEIFTHFLFECPAFDYERHDLDRKLGQSSRDLKTILSEPDNIRVMLRYIGRTRRFKQLGDVSIMKDLSH